MSLPPVDAARITVVVDNHVDMLLTSTDIVRRFGFIKEHFIPPHGEPVCTENGISYWIELRRDERRHHVLFDTGLTVGSSSTISAHSGFQRINSITLLSVMATPTISASCSGCSGSEPASADRYPSRCLPFPKYFLDAEGEIVMRINRGLDRRAIEAAGGIIVPATEPVELGPGTLTTGQISREVAFEPPVPVRNGSRAGAYLERDGHLINDDGVVDDQAVVLNVRGKGLVVMTACGHAGVINTIRQAQRVTGVEEIYAVMGGFHTGFPGVPESTGDATIAALAEIGPQIVAPMHCTGLRTMALALNTFGDRFLHNVVGTTLVL